MKKYIQIFTQFSVLYKGKSLFIPLFTTLFLLATTTHAQNYEWAKKMGGAGFEQGNDIAVDEAGNVYATGYFSGTVDFDPGAGIANLTSTGESNIFICKLDASGNYLWAKSIGGTTLFSEGRAIAIDGLGNVYATGDFYGTADFDPGPGTAELNSAGSQDIFICKFDASGNYLWAKNIGAGSEDIANDIAIDPLGNAYTTGYFGGTVDFDPSTGTAELTAAGWADIFICKLDASGNYLWAKSMGAAGGDISHAIAVDASSNVYTTGLFSFTVDFDPSPLGTAELTSTNNLDAFVCKLNASGNYVWAKNMGGGYNTIGYSIAVDNSENVYTTGYFEGTTDFDPNEGTAELTSTGYKDIFVCKFDPSGNYLWAKNMGGISYNYGDAIAVDEAGNTYTTGYFEGTADFNPDEGGIAQLTAGANDIFICKFDASGNYLWAKNMGGTKSDYAYGIALDPLGNVYTTGHFVGTADFDPNEGTAELTTAGGTDIFICKLSQTALGAEMPSSTSKINIYPTLTKDIILIKNEESNITHVAVYNQVGQLVLAQTHATHLDLTAMPTGLYFVQVQAGGKIVTQKVVKQ